MFRSFCIAAALTSSAFVLIPTQESTAQGLQFNSDRSRSTNSGNSSPTINRRQVNTRQTLRGTPSLTTRRPTGMPNQLRPRFPVLPTGPNVQVNPNIVRPTRPEFQVKPGVVKPHFPVKPGLSVNPQQLKPGALKPLAPNQLAPFNPQLQGNKTPKLPGGKLNGITKLAGIQKFEGLVGQLDKFGEQQVAPLKLHKFNGKFGEILKGANLKIDPMKKLQAKSFAIEKLSLHAPCHWWIDFLVGCNWHWNHCHWWDYCYTPGYWQCWTPCHYNVVYCPPVPGYVATSWYFGVDCILIPDMAAYGIQEVKLNSPADFAGLKQGDLITSINGEGISDESVLPNAVRTSGGLLQLGVIREGSDQPVLVDVALRPIRRLSY